ncbi:hypothetical protein QEN19_000353 [Hanseniaspora menglaensis]
MFSTNNFSKLNKPKTYIVSALSGIGIYYAQRVSVTISILTGFSYYIYLTLNGGKKKKKCCGGKNKSKTGKCCGGGDGSCCKPKVEKPKPVEKACCGGGSCGKKETKESLSKKNDSGFDEISTDFTAQFSKTK